MSWAVPAELDVKYPVDASIQTDAPGLLYLPLKHGD